MAKVTIEKVRAGIGATRGGLGALSDQQCTAIWDSMAAEDQERALAAVQQPGARGPVPRPPEPEKAGEEVLTLKTQRTQRT